MSLEGLPSQGSTGECPLRTDIRFAERSGSGGRGLGKGKGNTQEAGSIATPVRNPERVRLENINILMFQCGSGSIISEDTVDFRFGLIHQMSLKQPLV